MGMPEAFYEEVEIMQEDLYPNYKKTITDFMSDKNKELEFRSFIKKEREKDAKFRSAS
jgi:hypothetical protein